MVRLFHFQKLFRFFHSLFSFSDCVLLSYLTLSFHLYLIFFSFSFSGVLRPHPGFDLEYDEAVEKVQQIDQRLQQYLKYVKDLTRFSLFMFPF
jgi:hypothetical protein